MPMGFCTESCFLHIVHTAHRILRSKSDPQSKNNNWRSKNAAAACITNTRTKYGSRTGIERIPTLKVRLNLESWAKQEINWFRNKPRCNTANTDLKYKYKLEILIAETVECRFWRHFVKQFIESEIPTRFGVFMIIVTIREVSRTRRLGEITDNRHHCKLRILSLKH